MSLCVACDRLRAVNDTLRAEVARLTAERDAARKSLDEVVEMRDAMAQESAAQWLDTAADTIDPAGVYRHLRQQAVVLRESAAEFRARAKAQP